MKSKLNAILKKEKKKNIVKRQYNVVLRYDRVGV